MKKNWMTTTCGCVTAAATIVATCGFSVMTTKIAMCIAGIAVSVGQVLSRDAVNDQTNNTQTK